MKKGIIMVCAVMLAVSGTVFADYSVSGPIAGWADLGSLEKQWEARAKGQNSGWEIAAGTNVAVGGENTNEQVNPWPTSQPYNFEFSLSGDTISLMFPGLQEMVSYSGVNQVSDLFIQVRASNGYSLTVDNLLIDTMSLSDLSAAPGVQYLHISDISGDFTVTGSLSGDLDTGGNVNERVKMDIIGAGQAAVIPAPGAIVLGMIGAGLTGLWRRKLS